MDVQNGIFNESKRRKTANVDLNASKNNKITINLDMEELNRDLDKKDNHINFAFNSVKKRRLDQIDNMNCSRIPLKPEKKFNINLDKYQNFVSKIPRITSS
jgi:hypothetical protein